MRKAHGLRTRWTAAGLEIWCDGGLGEALRQSRRRRRDTFGDCIVAELCHIQLRHVWLWDDHGMEHKWKRYRRVVHQPWLKRLGSVLTMQHGTNGSIIFTPLSLDVVKWGTEAAIFNELCLNVIANYPEVMGRARPEQEVIVHHDLGDPHHVVEIVDSTLVHTWASTCTIMDCRMRGFTVEAAAATILHVSRKRVWAVPHHLVCRMKVLWAGLRRWKQTRRQYKALINDKRDQKARAAIKAGQKKWQTASAKVACALEGLDWERVHKLTGITPYQAQNLFRLKCNRLRIWAGKERGFRCMEDACRDSVTGGTMQLVWTCPRAQELWKMWTERWDRQAERTGEGGGISEEAMHDIFSLRLSHTPEWLVLWGNDNKIEKWELIHEVAQDLWALGCAVVFTGLWRRGVDKKYGSSNRADSQRDQVARCRGQIWEAFTRYRMSLFPRTRYSHPKIVICHAFDKRWGHVFTQAARVCQMTESRVQLGFFDGGARGNPGPGGSGSWMVEIGTEGKDNRVQWAAATALGHPGTTNNIAEFIGLQRLLAKAVQQNWFNMHVIGDSALILGMMRQRRPPKARRLQHWYRESCKLADICRVASWTHHYRKHNKGADWLANWGMDHGQSKVWMITADTNGQVMPEELMEIAGGDIERWIKMLGMCLQVRVDRHFRNACIRQGERSR